MYDIGKLYQAKDIDDAIQALHNDPQAVVICGGSDVLIKIREGKLAGASLVSIQNLNEIKEIKMLENETISIGPGCTFHEVTNHELIKKYVPFLGEAVDQAGGPQLRNIGTIGGNVCNAATSGDSGASLFLLNAKLVLKGFEGTRIVPIEEFYVGPGKTSRKHDEILVEILIEKDSYYDFFGHYIKYGKRKSMEIATLGCACGVKLSEDGTQIKEMRLAYGVAAPTPIRCTQIEQNVVGKAITDELYEMVGKGALDEVNPRSSWRASKEFRLQLVEELSKRALKQAILLAKGE